MSKQILTLYYTRIFIIWIFLFAITTSYSQETTIELPKMADQVVNDYNEVAIAIDYNSDKKTIEKLKFYSFAEFFKKYKAFPLETKSNWVKFQLKNNFTKKTVFYLDAYGAEFYLHKVNKKQTSITVSTSLNQRLDELLVAEYLKKINASTTKSFYLHHFSFVCQNSFQKKNSICLFFESN